MQGQFLALFYVHASTEICFFFQFANANRVLILFAFNSLVLNNAENLTGIVQQNGGGGGDLGWLM